MGVIYPFTITEGEVFNHQVLSLNANCRMQYSPVRIYWIHHYYDVIQKSPPFAFMKLL